jgi:23S rRNA (guanine745-N1)-methyltransferase
MALICPVCSQPLTKMALEFSCANRHSFDLAKEGYLNLLVRKGKAPEFEGDSPEMLGARRRFLEGGTYDVLLSRLIAVTGNILHDKPGVILDVGCGEGYYLGGIVRTIHKDSEGFGMDISKKAISMAAKRHSDVFFVVADTNVVLPFEDGSIDLLLDVFAPRNASEFFRVLKPGGSLVVIAPGPSHLQALREKFGLLGLEDDKIEKIKAKLGMLQLHTTESVIHNIMLSSDAVSDLINMMPSARFLSEEKIRKIREVEELEVGLDFVIMQFGKDIL